LKESCSKSSGRKRRHEEQKKCLDSTRHKIETINDMMGISSGKLACENIFCLTSVDLLDKAIKMEHEKQKQNEEKLIRQQKSTDV
jgi:hypothetical protein